MIVGSARIARNAQIQPPGKMQSVWMLNQVVPKLDIVIEWGCMQTEYRGFPDNASTWLLTEKQQGMLVLLQVARGRYLFTRWRTSRR
jgi:hypothetical protein